MQTVSENYKTIISDRYRVNTRLLIDGVTYDLSNIKSGTIDGSLFDDLSIGNAATRKLQFTLKGLPDIPRGATIQVQQRVFNSTLISEWVPKGTFFISKRNVNRVAKTTEIIAYDAMNKMDVPFMLSGEWVSDTALSVVQMICEDVGLALDTATEAALSDGYEISNVPAIGPSGTTRREMLQEIGVLYGGNWTISDENKLTLVTLNAAAGICYFDEQGYIWCGEDPPAGSSLWVQNSSGMDVAVPLADITDTDRVVYIDGGGLLRNGVYGDVIGYYKKYSDVDYVAACTNQAALAEVDKVKLINGSSEFKSEGYDTLPGTAIICNSAYATAETVARVLSKVQGYVYQPFEADRAYIDPATGLGDWLNICGLSSLMAQQTIVFSNTCPSNVSAPYEEESDDEYIYVSPVVRQIQRDQAQSYSRIEATENSIIQEVARATAKEGELSTKVEQTAEGLLITFNQGIADATEKAENDLSAYSEGVQEYIRFISGMIELGKRDSQIKALLQSTRLSFTGESGQEVAWFSNNQLFISEAVVNGKMTLQDATMTHKWVQTVNSSDGHFSGQYVHG